MGGPVKSGRRVDRSGGRVPGDALQVRRELVTAGDNMRPAGRRRRAGERRGLQGPQFLRGPGKPHPPRVKINRDAGVRLDHVHQPVGGRGAHRGRETQRRPLKLEIGERRLIAERD